MLFPFQDTPTLVETGGVVNMGNTCYMSAALQSLSNVRDLSALFLNSNHPITANLTKAKSPIALEYRALLNGLLVEGANVAPKRLKEVIAQRTALFADRAQHDCQEFLQILLDQLHEGIREASKESRETAMEEAEKSDGEELRARKVNPEDKA